MTGADSIVGVIDVNTTSSVITCNVLTGKIHIYDKNNTYILLLKSSDEWLVSFETIYTLNF